MNFKNYLSIVFVVLATLTFFVGCDTEAITDSKLQDDPAIKEKNSRLLTASKNGETKKVELLIKAGANLEAQTKWGETALILASEEGHTDTVKALIKAGADLNVKDIFGETALHKAANFNLVEVARVLVDAGADQSIVDDDGMPAFVLDEAELFKAFRNDNIEKVKFLITFGIDVNTKEKKMENGMSTRENTILLVASEKGYLDIVNMLIEKGADVNKGDFSGITPLMRAAGNNHVSIVKALIKAKANVNTEVYGNTALSYALKEGYTEVVKILVEMTDDEGRTPLMLASISGNAEIVRTNIEAGADINKKDKSMLTALMRASGRGYPKIVKLLLDAGADVNVKNRHGVTALKYASDQGHKNVVKLLKKAEAKE